MATRRWKSMMICSIALTQQRRVATGRTDHGRLVGAPTIDVHGQTDGQTDILRRSPRAVQMMTTVMIKINKLI